MINSSSHSLFWTLLPSSGIHKFYAYGFMLYAYALELQLLFDSTVIIKAI